MIEKSKKRLDANTNRNLGDLQGGEITRKLILAGYIGSKMGGYGYPQEYFRKLNTQVKASLKKDNIKQ